jgi:hypothetical protein
MASSCKLCSSRTFHRAVEFGTSAVVIFSVLQNACAFLSVGAIVQLHGVFDQGLVSNWRTGWPRVTLRPPRRSGLTIAAVERGVATRLDARQFEGLDHDEAITVHVVNGEPRHFEFKIKARTFRTGGVVACPSHGVLAPGMAVSIVVAASKADRALLGAEVTIPRLRSAAPTLCSRPTDATTWVLRPLDLPEPLSAATSPSAVDPAVARNVRTTTAVPFGSAGPAGEPAAVAAVSPLALARLAEYESTMATLTEYVSRGCRVVVGGRAGAPSPGTLSLAFAGHGLDRTLVVKVVRDRRAAPGATSSVHLEQSVRLRYASGVTLGLALPGQTPAASSSGPASGSGHAPRSARGSRSGSATGDRAATTAAAVVVSDAATARRTLHLEERGGGRSGAEPIHCRFVSSDDFEAVLAVLYHWRPPGLKFEWANTAAAGDGGGTSASPWERMGIPAAKVAAVRTSVSNLSAHAVVTPLDVIDAHEVSLFHAMALLDLMAADDRQAGKAALRSVALKIRV